MMSSSDSTKYNTLKEKGNERFKAKQFKEALRYYTDAISYKDDEVSAYTNRALCFIQLGRYFEAKADCDKAIRIDPLASKAYYRRAVAYKGLFDFENSINDYKKVAELDPTFELANKEIANIKHMLERDIRHDVTPINKPLPEFKSKLPIQTFELRNQYVGTLSYKTSDTQ